MGKPEFDPKTYAGPVVATAQGYLGFKRRDPGETFTVKAGEFSVNWMEVAAPVKAKPKADDDTDNDNGGGNGGGGSTDPVAIPPDWKAMHHKKRMALAKLISGGEVANVEQADTIIALEADQRDAKARNQSA